MSTAETIPLEQNSTTEKILRACCSQLASLGPKRTTLRGIADTIDVSFASITYHFGNKDTLLNAAFDFAIKEDSQLLGERAKLLSGSIASVNELAGLLIAACSPLDKKEQHYTKMRLDLQQMTRRDASLAPLCSHWQDIKLRYWQSVLPDSEDQLFQAWMCQGFIDTSQVLRSSNTETWKLSLEAEQCMRLAQCLLNGPQKRPVKRSLLHRVIASRELTDWEQDLPGMSDPSSVLEKLMQAVLQITSEDGIDALTHRAIALKAGVYQNSTAYYADHIEDLVHMALIYGVREIMKISESLDITTGIQTNSTSSYEYVERFVQQNLGKSGSLTHLLPQVETLCYASAHKPRFAGPIDDIYFSLGTHVAREVAEYCPSHVDDTVATQLFGLIRSGVITMARSDASLDFDFLCSMMHWILGRLFPIAK